MILVSIIHNFSHFDACTNLHTISDTYIHFERTHSTSATHCNWRRSKTCTLPAHNQVHYSRQLRDRIRNTRWRRCRRQRSATASAFWVAVGWCVAGMQLDAFTERKRYRRMYFREYLDSSSVSRMTIPRSTSDVWCDRYPCEMRIIDSINILWVMLT